MSLYWLVINSEVWSWVNVGRTIYGLQLCIMCTSCPLDCLLCCCIELCTVGAHCKDTFQISHFKNLSIRKLNFFYNSLPCWLYIGTSWVWAVPDSDQAKFNFIFLYTLGWNCYFYQTFRWKSKICGNLVPRLPAIIPPWSSCKACNYVTLVFWFLKN